MATNQKALAAGKKMLQENKGYNSLYKEYISQGKTPRQAEDLAGMTYPSRSEKTSKTTTSPATTNTAPQNPTSGTSAESQNFMNDPGVDNSASQAGEQFNKSWQDYIAASQGVFDIETQRQLQQYTQRRDDTNVQRQRNAEDYAKYTGREQQDFNRTLAMRDRDFASKLSQAANAYGQRGLLTGGLFKKASGEAVADEGEQQMYMKTLSQRKMEDAAQSQARGDQDISKSLQRLGESQSQYTTDRSVGMKNLGLELQTKGDTLWNQTQNSIYGIQQEQARQEALDRQYGVKTTPRLPVYRMGGAFTK